MSAPCHGDPVVHCGPTRKGEFARTVSLTDVHTGRVFTRSVRNNAHTRIRGALKAADRPRFRGHLT